MPDSPPYRVLARKYRPQRFAELIGQDAMVRTLGNAIARDRLAHAFLLTGVRGVGKTSTARLIAKALNCIGRDGQGGPTIDPCGVCEPCRAIAEGRHVDVIEIDAASHNGVDDIREISEAVRYAAVSARYKLYIIDEVHMLSKPAFNAVLKTLEEPPPHVKFLLATTEVGKIPVTVLSRCQRFDLRRIPADTLAAHFAHVVAAEGVEAEPEALALIARAAEGSARDGLSILDQAIAHGQGMVAAVQVRDMLGLSDRGAVRALFGTLLAGDAPGVLAMLAEQHALGVEPGALLKALLETCHGVTRAKVNGGAGGGIDPALSAEEREAHADWASRLGHATLHRLWQMLLKGHAEVQAAALPREAAEMALLRVVYAASMPDPGELARRIAAGEQTIPAAITSAAPEAVPASTNATPAPVLPARPEAAPLPATPEAFVAMLAGKKAVILAECFESARLIRFAPPEIVMAKSNGVNAVFAAKLQDCLNPKFGEEGVRWQIAVVDGIGKPSLHEQAQAQAADRRGEVSATPIVAAALAGFPGAELIDYSDPDAAGART